MNLYILDTNDFYEDWYLNQEEHRINGPATTFNLMMENNIGFKTESVIAKTDPLLSVLMARNFGILMVNIPNKII